MNVTFERNGGKMSQIVQIICEKCKKLEGIGQIEEDQSSTLTIRVTECISCAWDSGYSKGYNIGYSTGYLAHERGEKFH